jgi:hypothetical protein
LWPLMVVITNTRLLQAIRHYDTIELQSAV